MSSKEPNRQSLTRRQVVQALGGTGLVFLAGCSSGGASEGDSVATATSDRSTSTTSDGRVTTEASEETATGTSTESPAQTPTESIDTGSLESQISELSFEGSLFDTHAHWAGARDAGHAPLDPGTFATRMKENDVGACTLFTSSVETTQQYPSVLQQLATSSVEYLPFLQPQSRSHLVEGNVTEVYADHSAAFMGIGELIFYGGPMQGTSLTEEPWPELFAFAADEDVPLMIHPTKAQEEGLKAMLSDHSDATVMAHGGEFNLSPETLSSLLRNHDNLYWTVDAGSMLNGLVLTASDASEFANQYDGRKEEFKRLLEQILPPIMDAAPSRVMWGTDLATDWNTDPTVYSRVMDWTQAAIESLPADQQDKYASKNAKRLFGI